MTFGVLVKIAGYLWIFEPLEKMNRSLLPPSFLFVFCSFFLLLLRLVLLDLLC